MPLGVLPARNQVILTEQINNLKIRGNYHMDEGFIYFRNVEDRLLIGGARNIALDKEQTSEFGLTPEIQERLESILFEILGRSVKIEHRWSGILGIGNSKVPIVKKLKNGVFCAVKLSGMGIAIGTALGQEVANLAYQKNRNE
jgi:glycine/D-amino acid oxidase-like deaminating enzyme